MRARAGVRPRRTHHAAGIPVTAEIPVTAVTPGLHDVTRLPRARRAALLGLLTLAFGLLNLLGGPATGAGPGLAGRLVGGAAPAGALTPGQVSPGQTSPGLAPIPAAQGSQWYHAVLGLAEAHRISQGAGAVVAVIDGGVDATHPKLAGQLLPGSGIGPGAAPDGWRDDDPDGHGTAMAGIIAGRNDNGRPEVRGIAPAAKILPISTGAEADSDEVAVGIRRAVDLGADVINLSLGSAGSATDAEERAVGYALAHDVVVVASAGNTDSGDTEVNSPANIPGVVAVTGSTARGGFWSGSVAGPQAVIAAPGPGIRAPVPTRVSPDGLDTGGGTSNSAAIVSGVVALIRAARPDLDAPNVINRLIRTARDAGPPGRDSMFGFGVVDPVAALTRMVPVVTTNPLLAPPAGSPAAERVPAGSAPGGGTGGAQPGTGGGADGTGDSGLGAAAGGLTGTPGAAGSATGQPGGGPDPGSTAALPSAAADGTAPAAPGRSGPTDQSGRSGGAAGGGRVDGGSGAEAGAGATTVNGTPMAAVGPAGSGGYSPLVWLAALGLAVSLGILLGVAAHARYGRGRAWPAAFNMDA